MNAAARLVEVRVPDMGNFKDVAVIDVLVKPGESIETEAPLVTLETEKATMDVPSTASGVIEKLHVAKGGTVNAGDLIATVRAADGARPPAPAEQPAAKADPPPAAAAASAPLSPAVPAGSTDRAASPKPSADRKPAAAAAVSTPPQAVPEPSAEIPAALRTDLPPINEPGFSRAHAGPSVRKFARELGVDLTRVT
ncbi:MAG TPA: biotin/lipoyl-containing protein, partial [Steroidobacteraceae bacterium]|nr:biotin/lipoyl-containing protein [Steroidobacteraceae bacterium]